MAQKQNRRAKIVGTDIELDIPEKKDVVIESHDDDHGHDDDRSVLWGGGVAMAMVLSHGVTNAIGKNHHEYHHDQYGQRHRDRHHDHHHDDADVDGDDGDDDDQ